MPTLHEVQRAMRAGLIDRDVDGIAAMLPQPSGVARLDVYRNTIFFGLTRALRLAFPAVAKLVGEEFFEGAAQTFAAGHPPRAACLDLYGDRFPEFLGSFAPAQSVPYLADVARLEWAVSRALHAPDAPPLDLATLATLPPEAQEGLRVTPHPSLSVLQTTYPADAIWSAVLEGSDRRLASLDLATGPAFLVVERLHERTSITRMGEAEWHFLRALSVGTPLTLALEAAPEAKPAVWLAQHLHAGRFISFIVPDDPPFWPEAA